MATYAASAEIENSAVVVYSRTNGIETGNQVSSLTSSTSLSSTDISKVWTNSYTAQSGAVTLDLTALTDAYGQSITFGTLKGAFINNNHASETLTIGGGANPVLGTDQYTLKAGKQIQVTSSFTVAGGSKNLVLTPSGSMSFQLILVGS